MGLPASVKCGVCATFLCRPAVVKHEADAPLGRRLSHRFESPNSQRGRTSLLPPSCGLGRRCHGVDKGTVGWRERIPHGPIIIWRAMTSFLERGQTRGQTLWSGTRAVVPHITLRWVGGVCYLFHTRKPYGSRKSLCDATNDHTTVGFRPTCFTFRHEALVLSGLRMEFSFPISVFFFFSFFSCAERVKHTTHETHLLTVLSTQ
jgi:hypothetical protein